MGPDSTLIFTRLRYWEVLHLSSKCFLVIRSGLLFWPVWIKKFKWCYKPLFSAVHSYNHNTTTYYCIAPNFRGAKFSRIGLLKHFRRNKFRRSTILDGRARFSKHFAKLNFRRLRRLRENRENYAPPKFGAIRYARKQGNVSWNSSQLDI